MNTIENLLDNGIALKTAYMMLGEYSSRIGTINGVYEILDINYDFELMAKDVLLKCTRCGKTIHRFMKSGRNKWSDLIKTCECQKVEKELERQRKIELSKLESEKFKKLKKEQFEKELVSMVGGTFGDFEILEVADEKGFNLKCNDCETVIYMSYEKIRRGLDRNKICKCKRRQFEYDDSYVGNKYNYLTVLGIVKDEKNAKAFKCQCDCGEIVNITPCHVVKGIVKSCGCYFESLKLEHSEELDRLRRIHNGMMQRCYNKKSIGYKHYGGRGITICPEWHNRENFIEWALNNDYSNDLSIDRINVNGNYEPNNCRWATAKEQANNQRPRTNYTKKKKKTAIVDGVEKSISEWISIYGITNSTVAYRMKKYNLCFEDALKMPRIQSGRPRKEVVNA